MPSTFVDLSHTLDENVQVYPGDPTFSCCPVLNIKQDGWNVHNISMGTHTGTHVDAPYHFLAKGARIDDLPLSTFVGNVVVVDVTRKNAKEVITWEDISPHSDVIQRKAAQKHGVFVFLRTDWSQYWKSDAYLEHPFLARDAAQRLIDLGVKLIGVDALSPDETRVDGSTPDFGVHAVVLGAGAVLAENLTNLAEIQTGEWLVSLAPLKLKGCDGSPVRAFACNATSPIPTDVASALESALSSNASVLPLQLSDAYALALMLAAHELLLDSNLLVPADRSSETVIAGQAVVVYSRYINPPISQIDVHSCPALPACCATLNCAPISPMTSTSSQTIIDLTQPLVPGKVPACAGHPCYNASLNYSLAKGDFANVHALTLGTHTGTHIDAPYHFFMDGATVDQLDLSILSAVPAVVADLRAKTSHERIVWDDLTAAADEIQRSGARVLLLCTGWSRDWNTPNYSKHPFLDPDVARRLLDLDVQVIGLDTMSPDKVTEEEETADVHL
ncbi:hypothetical protein BN946_scf184985.g32 [Trametes cinnabarina]|uniref:Arylformamidase n=1 Tax=Pycnoporus cinnabarinus TaxID=5643 RepID=A0A060SJI5_PYCCI|nr:hypothetical protein BN946_scf184985.g32 [Trametes cinnabarina]